MNLAQQLINGVILGAGYACVAIGWTVLLGAARLVNFAHGQLFMLGAFVAWFAMHRAGVSYAVAIPVAVLVMAGLGLVLQLAMRRLVLEQNLTSLMIVTLGFGYVLQGAAAKVFGGNPQTLVSPLEKTSVRFGRSPAFAASATAWAAASTAATPLTLSLAPVFQASRCPPTTIHSSGRSLPGTQAKVSKMSFIPRAGPVRSSWTLMRSVAGPGPTW